jgi:hypothetical protein
MSEQAQPPYVEFATKAVEDRNASIEAGHFVGKDVDFAIVTARGSRDRVEHEIDFWLSKIDQDVKDGRIPPGWALQWKDAYKMWKSGQEMPEDGTPIRDWPVLSPAQTQILLSMRITTVEALASCNEESMGRIGMGGRSLRQKAIDWLKVSGKEGKVVEEMGALRAKLAHAEQENVQLKLKVDQYETERRSKEGQPGRSSGDGANPGGVHQPAAS